MDPIRATCLPVCLPKVGRRVHGASGSLIVETEMLVDGLETNSIAAVFMSSTTTIMEAVERAAQDGISVFVMRLREEMGRGLQT